MTVYAQIRGLQAGGDTRGTPPREVVKTTVSCKLGGCLLVDKLKKLRSDPRVTGWWRCGRKPPREVVEIGKHSLGAVVNRNVVLDLKRGRIHRLSAVWLPWSQAFLIGICKTSGHSDLAKR